MLHLGEIPRPLANTLHMLKEAERSVPPTLDTLTLLHQLQLSDNNLVKGLSLQERLLKPNTLLNYLLPISPEQVAALGKVYELMGWVIGAAVTRKETASQLQVAHTLVAVAASQVVRNAPAIDTVATRILLRAGKRPELVHEALLANVRNKAEENAAMRVIACDRYLDNTDPFAPIARIPSRVVRK